MAVSKIDIANMALTHIGMKPIANLLENSPAAISCNLFFENCRDDVFRESRWPFAAVRSKLLTATEEVLGWDYIYAYPQKAMTVWAVFDEQTTDKPDQQDFEVRFIPESNRKVICSNLADAYADYTYKVEDTSLYDPKFSMALSYRLAASIAMNLTGSAELGLKAMEVYNAIISEAKRISGSERTKKPVVESSYQNSRG